MIFFMFKVESMELKWKMNYCVLFFYLGCIYVFGLIVVFFGLMFGV